MSAGFAGLAGLQRPQHNGVYVQLRPRARACVFAALLGDSLSLSLPRPRLPCGALCAATRASSRSCLSSSSASALTVPSTNHSRAFVLSCNLPQHLHRASCIAQEAYRPLHFVRCFFRWHVVRCFVSVACCPLSVARCPLHVALHPSHGVLQPSAALLTPAALSRTAAAQSAASRCRTLHGTGPLVVGPLQRQQSTIYS
jgi:hypothetical protein